MGHRAVFLSSNNTGCHGTVKNQLGRDMVPFPRTLAPARTRQVNGFCCSRDDGTDRADTADANGMLLRNPLARQPRTLAGVAFGDDVEAGVVASRASWGSAVSFGVLGTCLRLVRQILV